MCAMAATDSTHPKPLRLWPGIAAVLVQWVCWFLVPIVRPEFAVYGMLGGAIFGDRRFGRVFIYHNGAESYYGGRGFRTVLRV